MVNNLRIFSTFCLIGSLAFLVYVISTNLQSQYLVQAQNANTTKLPLNDSSHFFIPPTISEESKTMLKNITSNMWPSIQYPEPDDWEGWNALNQQIESMTIFQSKPILENLKPNITFTMIGNVTVIDVKPRNWIDSGNVLIYTHGGGYTLLSANSTLGSAATVANLTGHRVISVDYTLAPISKWNQTTSQVVSVIKALVKDQGYKLNDIALFGDSAGGGLVAGSVLKLRDEGMGIPAAVVLWSPWTDVSREGDTYVTLKNADIFNGEDLMLNMANAYAKIEDQKNPYVSPVYGNFSNGFPPTLIQVGTKEILLSDSVRLYQALDQVGIPVKLDVYEGMPHVFQTILIDTPEYNLAMEKTGQFIKEYLN
jgi:acetyl esterase/lipase